MDNDSFNIGPFEAPATTAKATSLMADASGTNFHGAVTAFRALEQTQALTWADATDKQRSVATYRSVIVQFVQRQPSIQHAIIMLRDNIGACGPSMINIMNKLKSVPSRATIYNWINAYKAQGAEGLLPTKRIRQRELPWHARCLALYHAPNKPSFAQVADQLVTERLLNGSKTKAHHKKVGRFIAALPAILRDESKWRIGAKLYREREVAYKIRDTTSLAPGDVYNADGHTIDVYLAHPVTGKAWRPELTVFQDVASRYIVGWELSDAESSYSTMVAFTRAIATHEHVPAIVYCDNGSGYKSKLMSDETTGVFARFGVSTLFAIPGNARAKWVERFFRDMEGRVGKRFPTYCGPGHTERHKQLMLKEAKQQKRQLPTVAEWVAEFEHFLHDYHNNRQHPERTTQTRAEVWGELKHFAPSVTDYRVLPRTKVNVRRGAVVFDKRTYRADNLHHYNSQTLIAGYDMHDDGEITLYDMDGSFLMFADLAQKVAAIPKSRIEEAKAKRLADQNKRLENKARENEARAARTRTIEASATAVQALGIRTPELDVQDAETVDFDFDDLREMMHATATTTAIDEDMPTKEWSI